LVPTLVSAGVLVSCGAGMLVCAGIGALADGRELWALIAPGLACGALGGGLIAVLDTRAARAITIRPTTGFAAVTCAWVVAAAAAAVPLLAAGTLTSPLHAYFEAMSGFTTAGASVITDLEAQPDGILMWRCATQWLGGVGIVVLVVAVAPVSGPALQRAFYAEMSGVTADRLTPRIVDTAKIIAGIYVALTAAGALAYLLAGMGPFDALAHALTTLATGGFSTREQSLAAFDSQAIEIVAIVGMILGAINFAFYWRAAQGRPARPQLAEIKAFAAILVGVSAVVVASLLVSEDVEGLGTALREGVFSVVSIGTSTGFTTADFDGWNQFVRLGLLLLMFVGGCAGSTAGGMKVIRVVLLGVIAKQEVQRQLQPAGMQVLRFGGRAFPEKVRATLLGFALIYATVFLVGALAFALAGIGFDSALSAAAASINIVGPGLGEIGAAESYAALPPGALIVSMLLMLIGRLEVFTVVALLAAALRLRR
jgi:trk system potassium uptake protein TrkH